MPDDLRTYDLVLYGATGFVGELTAAHLAEHAPATTRSRAKATTEGRADALRA